MNETNKLMATQIFEWLDFTVDIIEILQFIGDLRELVDAILQALGGNFEPLGDWIEAFVADPWPGFEWLSALGDWTALTNIFEPLGAVGDAIGGVIDTILSVINAIISAIRGVPIIGGAVTGRMEEMKTEVTGLTSTAVTADANAVQALLDSEAAHTAAMEAIGNAASAVSAAEEAANAAAAAEELADIAYNLSSYWEAECVVSSAEVLLGVNELLIGLCQNVPTSRTRKITDLHIALQAQPGGMQLQTKKWNAAGTSNSVIHTATLGANVTRISYNNLELNVVDKERVFWNVSSITGSVPPTVLQCLVFGVIL